MATLLPLWQKAKQEVQDRRHGYTVKQGAERVPKRLYKALPAVLLGVLFNALDAVSTGLLIFPSEKQSTSLGSLQLQAMSMYIMSTIMSQVTMTFGGSKFPGALGSMLIEVLPFLRGIAKDIQDEIGDGHPSLIPTVFAAYCLTSFLVGAVFVCLAVFRCGQLVEYFPQTVLTGAIGAIGMSLFLLALELTLAPSAPVLTLNSAKDVLFDAEHLPLLFASFVPAILLSVSIRLPSLEKASFGFTQHALYIPIYMFAVAAIFWITVAGIGSGNANGLDQLSSRGWLFTLHLLPGQDHRLTSAWNYWTWFDFSLVHWSAMSNAVQNIVLLVVIGVLNLPIYIPAMALSLGVPVYHMNHELFGHGISNLLAGVVGTVPNLVVFSSTRFFTLAGGGRFEATVVIMITIGLYFVSSLILPYIPTILASALVLFLGIELMADALWESIKTVTVLEYIVIMGTFLASTFVGFAPGFGVGLALAILVQSILTTIDSRPHLFELSKKKALYRYQRMAEGPEDGNNLVLGYQSTRDDVTVISLTGYVFFAIVPSLESRMRVAAKLEPRPIVIIDMSKVHRVETSVLQWLDRQAREIASQSWPAPLLLTGVKQGSGVHADLRRGGIDCRWLYDGDSDATSNHDKTKRSESSIWIFDSLKEALDWARCRGQDSNSDNSIISAIRHNLAPDLVQPLFAQLPCPDLPTMQRLREIGIYVRRLPFGAKLMEKEQSSNVAFIIIRGRMRAKQPSSYSPQRPQVHRPSLQTALTSIPRNALHAARWLRSRIHSQQYDDDTKDNIDMSTPAYFREQQLRCGDAVGLHEMDGVGRVLSSIDVSSGPCWILEADKDNKDGIAWLVKARAMFLDQQNRDRVLLRET